MVLFCEANRVIVCSTTDRGVAYSRVGEVPDAVLGVGGPRAHGEVVVLAGAADGSSEEITPAFAHSAALAPTETSTVGRTAGQASAQAMRELVNDDAGLEVTISEGLGGVPYVHPHSAILTVGWL